MTPSEVHELVAGAYLLETWHESGNILKAPDVDARFVLLDGIVMAILHRTVKGVRTTVAQYGTYTLDAGTFAYCYTDRTEFPVQPATAAGDDPEGIRFGGVRRFAVEAAEDRVRLISSSVEQREFVFTPQGMTYSEHGNVLRTWRRAG